MIRICDVSDCPDAVDTLVGWNDRYWYELTPEVDLDEWYLFYRQCVETRGTQIPVTLVGLDDGEVFGAVTIVAEDDIQDFPEYSPWIAGLIVGEQYRGRDLGLVLMDAALEKARLLGYQAIYLWTDSRSEWYRAQGWSEVCRMRYSKVEATIMRFQLPSEQNARSVR